MDLGLSVNEFSTRHPTFANPQTWGTLYNGVGSVKGHVDGPR